MGRPKQPEALRQSLLDHAIALVLTQGLHGLTTDAVARAAGVSKGGLFHHFASKPALVEAVAAEAVARMAQAIDARLSPDPARPGRFTRAYVGAVVEDTGSAWSLLSLLLLAEPSMQRLWDDWIAAQLELHAATDAGPDLAILRLAADGIWLGQTAAMAQGLPRAALLDRLAHWLDRAAPEG
ncbi:TetR/AcrR family transcriptional regulator [Neotabrizicola sp. VNH66]|uniref:TetR/AcrR family transcriptional regulator n=1 Tax=Neotabrizicola sp. VNH66 TaxID=3400918 RepID=UPI003C00A8DA